MAASGLVLSPSTVATSKESTIQRGLDYFTLSEKPIQVLLATLGPNFSMEPLAVCKLDTIESIKVQIQALKGFYVDQQRLVYGGRELIQDKRLQDYGVSEGDTLHLVLRISDLVSITVNTAKGDSVIYRVKRTESVRDLKRQISDREGGLPLGEQILTLKGEYLDDSAVIEDISVDGEAVLYLVVQKPIDFKSKFVGRTAVELVMSAKVTRIQEPVASKTGIHPKSYFSQQEELCSLRQAALPRSHSSIQLSKYPIGFEVSDSLKDLVEHVKMGLHAGQAPKLTSEGSGGVYLMKDECGMQSIAVFKPMDEEPMAKNNPRGFTSLYLEEGLKKGTRSGEGAIREVVAYILDHPVTGRKHPKKSEEGFAGVPQTAMVRCYHEAFNYSRENQKLYRKFKLGSLQQYVPAVSSCEDMGASMFPVEEVHKITVLDLRLANTDRNGGNILVCKGNGGALKLVPIDHGYCLPDNFEECTFEWLYWPQACQPYSASTLKYIESLDAEKDIALLRQCGWNIRPQFACVLRVSTMLLKKGAAAGVTPFQIGSIMSRVESLDVKSPIECILEEAESRRRESFKEEDFLNIVSGLLDNFIASVETVHG